jgi:hypothetical protein
MLEKAENEEKQNNKQMKRDLFTCSAAKIKNN